MKRTVTLLLCLTILLSILIPLRTDAYTTNQRSKAIHVVYDDSGSMIRSGGVYLDRWEQAKYAMEVFAAMLEERDSMRVYFTASVVLE